ncbi:MAG TPA: hypothetical protein VEA40_19485 [Ramlibacter sp.]|nr:hypothetical protein [Ramlibacter sp.]
MHNENQASSRRLALLRRWALVAATASALAACGGGGGGGATPAPAPAPAIDGGVVKGPVSGATVCVYAIAAGAKGAQIAVTAGTGATGTVANGCYVTAADGSYNLRLPAGTSGDVLVEASGGSFCSNESAVAGGACSGGGALVNLGATVMSSVASVPASGTATVYTTPLTTAAVDNVRGRGLSSANFAGEFTTLAGRLLGAGTTVTPSQAPTLASQGYLATVADFLRTGGSFSAALTSLAAGTTTNITLVNAPAVTRGFWAGTTTGGPDGSTQASAVILPDLTTWIVHETAMGVVGVSKATASATASNTTTASISGNGFYYPLAGGTRQTVTATGSVNKSGTLTATASTGTTTATHAWSAVSGFTTAATAANATGTWSGAAGGGTLEVTWTITAASTGNNVQGNSTTGCQYAGTLRPHAAGVAVYSVAVVETCGTAPNNTTKTLDGIATLNAARTRLNVTYTTDAGAAGGLLALTKQ